MCYEIVADLLKFIPQSKHINSVIDLSTLPEMHVFFIDFLFAIHSFYYLVGKETSTTNGDE